MEKNISRRQLLKIAAVGAVGAALAACTPNNQVDDIRTKALADGIRQGQQTAEAKQAAQMATQQPTLQPAAESAQAPAPQATPKSTETAGGNGEVLNPVDPAATFGDSTWADMAANWKISRFNENRTNGYGLNPEPNGEHVRIKTAGRASEAYLDLKDGGGISFFEKISKGRRALVFVTNGQSVPNLDIRGGTMWETSLQEFKDDKLVHNLWNQLNEREAKEQPGALVIPVGFTPECVVPTTQIKGNPSFTAQDAAKAYGVDTYTKNPNNWKVTYGDDYVTGVMLEPDSTGNHHRIANLGDAFYEGYLDVKDDHKVPFTAKLNRRPVAFVGFGQAAPSVDLRSATVWRLKPDVAVPQLYTETVKLFDKLVDQEKTAQPGILVLPFGFNPNLQACV